MLEAGPIAALPAGAGGRARGFRAVASPRRPPRRLGHSEYSHQPHPGHPPPPGNPCSCWWRARGTSCSRHGAPTAVRSTVQRLHERRNGVFWYLMCTASWASSTARRGGRGGGGVLVSAPAFTLWTRATLREGLHRSSHHRVAVVLASSARHVMTPVPSRAGRPCTRQRAGAMVFMWRVGGQLLMASCHAGVRCSSPVRPRSSPLAALRFAVVSDAGPVGALLLSARRGAAGDHWPNPSVPSGVRRPAQLALGGSETSSSPSSARTVRVAGARAVRKPPIFQRRPFWRSGASSQYFDWHWARTCPGARYFGADASSHPAVHGVFGYGALVTSVRQKSFA